jgi:uroporphyrinogen-III synthase
MNLPLAGRTVALAEGRQLQELADMLQKEGATPLPCPLLSILDAPDSRPVLGWLRELTAGRFQTLILLTGEGLRRLLSLAEREGCRDAVVAAVARTRTITRGPKPVRALREIGLTPGKVSEVPTSEGVIAALQSEPLAGQAVGLQAYPGVNPALEKALRAAGATVHTVHPYVYAPAADAERVVGLIRQMADGKVDAILFTSSPQIDRLVEVAGEQGLEATLRQGLERTHVAAVGPVIAESLQRQGVRVDVCPEQGFVMKNLVQQLKRALSEGRQR